MQSARTSTASRALAVSIACILALFGLGAATLAITPEKAHAGLAAGAVVSSQTRQISLDGGATVLVLNIDWVIEMEDASGTKITVKSEKMRQALLARGINVNIGDSVWFGKNGSIKVVSSSTGKTYKGGYSTTEARRDIRFATVKIVKEVKYDGKPKKPAITVKYHGKTLKRGRDYTVKYSNNVNPGLAIVKITGKGRFGGGVTDNFRITRKKSTANLKAAKMAANGHRKPVVANVEIQADGKKMIVKTRLKGDGSKEFGKYLVATKVWVEKYGSKVFDGNGTTYSKSAKLGKKKTLKVRAAAVVIDQNTGKVKYTGKKSRSYKVKVPAQLRKTKGKTKLSISLYYVP